MVPNFSLLIVFYIREVYHVAKNQHFFPMSHVICQIVLREECDLLICMQVYRIASTSASQIHQICPFL